MIQPSVTQLTDTSKPDCLQERVVTSRTGLSQSCCCCCRADAGKPKNLQATCAVCCATCSSVSPRAAATAFSTCGSSAGSFLPGRALLGCIVRGTCGSSSRDRHTTICVKPRLGRPLHTVCPKVAVGQLCLVSGKQQQSCSMQDTSPGHGTKPLTPMHPFAHKVAAFQATNPSPCCPYHVPAPLSTPCSSVSTYMSQTSQDPQQGGPCHAPVARSVTQACVRASQALSPSRVMRVQLLSCHATHEYKAWFYRALSAPRASSSVLQGIAGSLTR